MKQIIFFLEEDISWKQNFYFLSLLITASIIYPLFDMGYFGIERHHYVKNFSDLLNFQYLMLSINLFFSAAIEEVLFRLPLALFMNDKKGINKKTLLAIIFLSIIFSLAHPLFSGATEILSITRGFFVTTILGLILGIIFVRVSRKKNYAKGIIICTLLHTFYNLFMTTIQLY